MDLTTVAQNYLLYIKHEQGVAKATAMCYTSWTRHFLKWLNENGYQSPSVENFNADVLRRYLYYLGDRNLRPRSIRGAFYPLRGLSKHLFSTGLIASDVATAIHLPKLDSARRQLCTDLELGKLIEATDRFERPRDGALAKWIILGISGTGLRTSEFCNLRLSDWDAGNRSLIVRSGKGGKGRASYPSLDACNALAEWLVYRGQVPHDYIMAFGKTRRVTDDGLRGMIERTKIIAGLRDQAGISPHSIRHRYATRIMENGANIRQIQAALGHSDAKTTMTYLHLQDTEAKAVRGLAELPAHAVIHRGEEVRQVRRVVRRHRPFNQR